jgi:predicted GNAT family acetyltransferase
MLDLVAHTQPGPFTRDTRLLGTYLGIRRQGSLVAMAGERMHPEGWTEISAICTDPAVRGQGLASRLTAAVAHGIRERGDAPFLHVAASNVNAVRLYEAIGFVRRREVVFSGLSRAAGLDRQAPNL